ncbi:hypothetical protein JCM5350_002853 [Sporobolomyces pararoseus]
MRQGDDSCERNLQEEEASASSLPVNQHRRRRSPSPVESSHRSNPHRNRNDRSLSLSPRYSPYTVSSPRYSPYTDPSLSPRLASAETSRSCSHQKKPSPSPPLLRLPRPPIPLRPSLSSSQLPLDYPDLVRIYLPLSKGTIARYLTSYFTDSLDLQIYNLALLADHAPSYALFDIERTTWEDGTLNRRISEVEQQGRDLFKDNEGKVWDLRPRLAVPPRVNHDDRASWNHRSHASGPSRQLRRHRRSHNDSSRSPSDYRQCPSQSPERSLPPRPVVVPDYYNHLSTHGEGGQIPQYSYPYISNRSAPFDFHNQRRDFPSPSRTIASDQPSFYRGLIDFNPSQSQQPWPQQAWDQPPRQQPSTQLWSNRTYETHLQNCPPSHHRDSNRYPNDDQQSRVGGWSVNGWRQIDQNELKRERIEREREWEYWDAANGRYRNGSYRR